MLQRSIKSTPILFSTPMIQALLDGRKTQTRRIIKPQPYKVEAGSPFYPPVEDKTGCSFSPIVCPYGKVGDLLWVRENFKVIDAYEGYDSGFADDFSDGYAVVEYKTGEIKNINNLLIDDDEDINEPEQAMRFFKRGSFIPSIHQPKWASRLTLKITNIRVERTQDINRLEDLHNEGCMPLNICGGIIKELVNEYWKPLWVAINGQTSWDNNPWVWVIEFKVHKCNFVEIANG